MLVTNKIEANGIKLCLRTDGGVNVTRFLAAAVNPCREEFDLLLIYLEICSLMTHYDTSER
jgi:hypothetical protein